MVFFFFFFFENKGPDQDEAKGEGRRETRVEGPFLTAEQDRFFRLGGGGGDTNVNHTLFDKNRAPPHPPFPARRLVTALQG